MGDNEFIKKVATYGGIILLSAAAGAAIYQAVTGEEEERPPIIVHNGSIDISSAYADDTNQNKGNWQPDTGAKTYSQFHQLTGPKDTKNVIINAGSAGTMTCSGGAGTLRSGGLRITFTDETTSWWVEIGANAKMKQMQIDPKDQKVTIAPEGADPSHVVIKPTEPPPAGATRISVVESLNGNGKCEFTAGSAPIILMQQKH